MRSLKYRIGAAVVCAGMLAASAIALRASGGPCFGLPVASATVPATGGDVPIGIVAQPPCAWTVESSDDANAQPSVASGNDTGTVTVHVQANAGPSRDFTITIAGQLFLIHQTGTNCEYTIAADPPLARAAGGGGSLSIATGAACQWTASTFTRYFDLDTFVETETPTTWVHLGQTSGVGPATIAYTVDANPNPDTRSTYVGFTDAASGGRAWGWLYEAKVMLAQTGAVPASVTPWQVGDIFAGLGAVGSNRGTYRPLSPLGEITGPDLHDAFVSSPIGEFGGVTTGC